MIFQKQDIEINEAEEKLMLTKLNFTNNLLHVLHKVF